MIKTNTSIALLAAAIVIPAAAKALTVSTISQVSRPTANGAEQISGITYAGGNLFYTVDDNDNKLYPLTLNISRSNGSLAASGISIGAGVTISGGNDMEGCAFDPASGKVWISQETSALIREYDPGTGTLLRSAPVPTVQKSYSGNYSLEALTIAGDGRTMWTANEEALTVDGPLATNSVGSVVRLTRFTREGVRDNWTPAGEWAYVTQPIGTAKDSHTRSGVSGLCALPDGTLLVLERRCYQGGVFPDFNIRLYQVNFGNATDVSSIASLKNAAYTATTKTLLWQYTDGSDMPNYEGICLGPRLDDGSCVLVLISDGGSYAEEGVFTLKLSGLGVRTMYFSGEAVAEECEPVGGPYRYQEGSTVVATLPGAGNPYEAATRVHAQWALVNNPSVHGEGSSASFAATVDDTLRWSSTTNTDLPLLATDSFEHVRAGAEAPELAGWSGEGIVAAEQVPAPSPAGYPLEQETHTQVLVVDGGVVRDYPAVPGSQGAMLDTMVRVTPEHADSPTDDADGQVALYFNAQGQPMLQHRSADGVTPLLRTRLSTRAYASGEWLRVSFRIDYANGPAGTAWCQVRLDGEPCVTTAGVRSPADPRSPGSWYRTLAGAAVPGRISQIVLNGSGAVDDVALYAAGGTFEFANPAAATNGVPFQWLADNGLPWDDALSDFDADGSTARDEYAAGTDPLDEEDSFRIVGVGFDSSDRFQVRFLGGGDLSRFHMFATDRYTPSTNGWAEVSGTFGSLGGGTNVWTQESTLQPAAFYRVRAALPE